MCKRLIYLISFLSVLAFVQTVTYAQQVKNLVLNPSFEEDEVILDDPVKSQWAAKIPAEGAGSNATIVDTDSIDGLRSLRIEPIGFESGHFIVANMSFPLGEGTVFTVSFWAKAEEPRPLAVEMSARFGPHRWGYADFHLTTEWAQYTMTSLGESGMGHLGFLCAGSEVSFWLDFVNVYEGEYVAGIKPSLSSPTEIATDPIPADRAESVDLNVELRWTAGLDSVSDTVYFGDNFDDVNNATGGLSQVTTTYNPGPLELAKTYYWRVDEFDAISTHKGNVWSFTTADFIIVDDFESYNEINPSEPGGNRIFISWIDGFDNPNINGSVVGNGASPEWLIVHSGNKSMPLYYDNAVGKSEATLNLTSNRDWTVNGVNALTIWFRGSTSNVAENLYVALNGSAVVDHNNPDATQISSWTAWNIDLQAFAGQGVDLSNVRRITLGLGNRSNPVAGGSGLMYFDDIRLHIKVAVPYASEPNPMDCTMYESTWVNLFWTPGESAVSHDVYLGDNLDDVNNGAEGTFIGNQAETFIVAGFQGFPYPDGLVPGTTYYWRIDEINDTEPNSPWKGDVWSFSIPSKTAYLPDPADAGESVAMNANLTWTGGFGAKQHTVYFGDNFDDVNNAAGGLPQGAATFSPGPLEMAKTYYWRVDEFDAVGTHKGNVWSFITEGAVGSPDPAKGAVDVTQTPVLAWVPGVFADTHEVYFGADEDAVKNADTGSPEYKGTRALGAESYDPGMLEWDTAYYWRIDEVNSTNPDSPWTGILWSFTTANFLVVDDFESYNDLDPAEPDSNRIFNAWLDGYDDPTNGSLVGYETPPFAEQTIVHGGNQSLPLYYDNSVGNSEATLTLTYPRDWTENRVNTLRIWFRGNSDNAAETIYVALNGNAIVTNDNPEAAQVTIWTQWTVDLQAFADQGVNLANVNTISLGLGDKNNPQAGGSGTMYFDDIRLYPPPPEPAP